MYLSVHTFQAKQPDGLFPDRWMLITDAGAVGIQRAVRKFAISDLGGDEPGAVQATEPDGAPSIDMY